MRSRLILALGAVAVAVVTVAGRQSAPPPQTVPPVRAVVPRSAGPAARSNAPVIIGQVVDTSGNAVPRAVVRLIGDRVIDTVLTDPKGRFFFTSIPAGEVVVTAQKFGFFDGGYGQRRASGLPLPFTLSTGQAMANMQIEVFRGAVITGSVVDEAGEPVAGARVVAMRRQFASGQWQYVAADSDDTDDQGFYRIFGLQPGEYIVATPSMSFSVPLSAGATSDGRDGVYPTQFYPATDHRILALPLTLAAGDVRYAVNFNLPLVPARRVTGRLIGEPGTTGDQIVRLVPFGTDSAAGDEAAATVSEANGTFTFARVPRGRYWLEAGDRGTVIPSDLSIAELARAEAANAVPKTFWARAEVTVDDVDAVLEDVEMRPTVVIAGRVLFERAGGAREAAAASPTRVRVDLEPAGPGISGGATLRVTPNGEFSATNLVPGEYYLRIGALPPGWFLKSITAGGGAAMDTPIDVREGGDTSAIVMLTTRGTEIIGSVRDSRMQAASGATVIILPAATGGDAAWTPNRTREARASANGVFIVERPAARRLPDCCD